VRLCGVGELNAALSTSLPGNRQDVRVWFRPLGAFGLLQLRQAISAITLGLDHVFYPGHRKQPIDRPIFIIGNPRSGNHISAIGCCSGRVRWRLLELWEMLFSPAITARKLLGGIVPRLDKLSPARYHPVPTYTTPACAAIETDDVAWFFRTLDGPFAWAYFLAWQDNWGVSYRGASSASTMSRPARRSGSSITTTHAGGGT